MAYYPSLARVRRSHARQRGLHSWPSQQLDGGSR